MHQCIDYTAIIDRIIHLHYYMYVQVQHIRRSSDVLYLDVGAAIHTIMEYALAGVVYSMS